jgi:hypothetical protein
MRNILIAIACMIGIGLVCSVSGDYILAETIVPYVSEPPILNGNITASEYKRAVTQYWDDVGSYGVDDGTIYLYTMHDRSNMYIAIDVVNDESNNCTYGSEFNDGIVVLIDVNNSHTISLTEGDIMIEADCTGLSMGSGGIIVSGFNKTNLSTTPHRIWEISIPLVKLPSTGTYFGVFIFGVATYNTSSRGMSGYAYPPRAMNDTDSPDTTPSNVDYTKFAQWTLSGIIPPLPSPINDLAPFVGTMLVGTIAVTTGLILIRDEAFVGERFDVGVTIIAVSTLILVVGYLQGWFKI